MANHARRRTQSDCVGRPKNDPESIYSSWKFSRPDLFRQRQPGLREPMATNTTTSIAVIADDQDHLIHLPVTCHDCILDKSIISKSIALATHGRIKATNPVTLVTSFGQHFTSSNAITLRWRYDAGMQSFHEKFWIVDSLTGCDAILRKDIETLEDGNGDAKAFPVQFGKRDAKGRADREEKQLTKEQRDAEYRKEVERQKEQMKKGLETLKPVPPVR